MRLGRKDFVTIAGGVERVQRRHNVCRSSLTTTVKCDAGAINEVRHKSDAPSTRFVLQVSGCFGVLIRSMFRIRS